MQSRILQFSIEKYKITKLRTHEKKPVNVEGNSRARAYVLKRALVVYGQPTLGLVTPPVEKISKIFCIFPQYKKRPPSHVTVPQQLTTRARLTLFTRVAREKRAYKNHRKIGDEKKKNGAG